MGWLDANEYFLMEIVAGDRVADIRRTIVLALASTNGGYETPRDIPEAGWARPESGAVETGPFRGNAPALGAPGVAR
jgi:hypothetical protein